MILSIVYSSLEVKGESRMVNKNLITKIALIVIALLLVLTVFAIRAETINLGRNI